MTTMNLMNTISVTLISVASKAVIETAYFDGTGISFDDAGIANYRLIEQDKKNFFELWILWNNGDFVRYEEFYPSFAGKDFETEVLIADPSVPF